MVDSGRWIDESDSGVKEVGLYSLCSVYLCITCIFLTTWLTLVRWVPHLMFLSVLNTHYKAFLWQAMHNSCQFVFFSSQYALYCSSVKKNKVNKNAGMCSRKRRRASTWPLGGPALSTRMEKLWPTIRTVWVLFESPISKCM